MTSDPTRTETCNLGNRRSDNFGEAWCHTHNVAAAGHFGSAEPVDWREMFLRVGQKWTALLEHFDLAEDATTDDVLAALSTPAPLDEDPTREALENDWLARLVKAERENHCGDAACMTRRVSAAIRVLTGGKEHQDYCWAIEEAARAYTFEALRAALEGAPHE